MPEEPDEDSDHGHYEDFGILTPITVLPSGVGIYDKTSFPKHLKTARLIAAPEQPQIVKVDDLELLTDKLYTLGAKTVLTFHGYSTKDYWRQKFSPYRPVEEIIAEIEEQGIPIDALSVCNHAGYILPEEDGKVAYTYVIGKAQLSFSLREGGILVAHMDRKRDGDVKIKTGEKIEPVIDRSFMSP